MFIPGVRPPSDDTTTVILELKSPVSVARVVRCAPPNLQVDVLDQEPSGL
jgi:hypothetical protein